jgi:hypothetical protein
MDVEAATHTPHAGTKTVPDYQPPAKQWLALGGRLRGKISIFPHYIASPEKYIP